VFRLDRVTQKSLFIDRTIKDWISGLDVNQRRIFVDALFEILGATKARSFTELSSNWLKNAVTILQSFNTIDDATKNLIGKTLGALVKSVRHNLPFLVLGEGEEP
jgi:hypothetical protein